MLKIIYTKDGKALNDFHVNKFVGDTIGKYIASGRKDTVIKIAHEGCLTLFELPAVKGIIDEDDIEFYFEDEKLEFNIYNGLKFPKSGRKMGFFADNIRKVIDASYQNFKKNNIDN